MPEDFQHKTVFSLAEVMGSIKKTLSNRYRSAYWIKAEMNKLNYYAYSGHCYPDLVEKSHGKIQAQIRAVIWNSDYEQINRKFQETLHHPLTEGSKILCLARIHFDATHGLSLRILDIDPSYSLGELEREKQETIRKLQSGGYFQLNKSLTLALLPQRIAILSVETSKGYVDFIRILKENPKKYAFTHQLFPVKLQGAGAVQTLIRQLRHIEKIKSEFDVVVIVRGGGTEHGLAAFNDYELSLAAARFPLPIFTGIGHATNETVVEMIAYKNAITPTQIANILLDSYREFEQALSDIASRLHKQVSQLLQYENLQLAHLNRNIPAFTLKHLEQQKILLSNFTLQLSSNQKQLILQHRQALAAAGANLKSGIHQILNSRQTQLNHIEQKIRILHPENILKRGFSITRINGKIINDSRALNMGDLVETILASGELTSKIVYFKKEDSNENQ